MDFGRGASRYLTRAIQYGVSDLPAVPFVHGAVARLNSQTTEERDFARLDQRGVRSGIYDDVKKTYALGKVAHGRLVSLDFTVGKGEGLRRKEPLVVNIHR